MTAVAVAAMFTGGRVAVDGSFVGVGVRVLVGARVPGAVTLPATAVAVNCCAAVCVA